MKCRSCRQGQFYVPCPGRGLVSVCPVVVIGFNVKCAPLSTTEGLVPCFLCVRPSMLISVCPTWGILLVCPAQCPRAYFCVLCPRALFCVSCTKGLFLCALPQGLVSVCPAPRACFSVPCPRPRACVCVPRCPKRLFLCPMHKVLVSVCQAPLAHWAISSMN